MRQGKVLFRTSQTFERRSTAAAWIEHGEESLARPGALDARKAQPKSKKTKTLGVTEWDFYHVINAQPCQATCALQGAMHAVRSW